MKNVPPTYQSMMLAQLLCVCIRPGYLHYYLPSKRELQLLEMRRQDPSREVGNFWLYSRESGLTMEGVNKLSQCTVRRLPVVNKL